MIDITQNSLVGLILRYIVVVNMEEFISGKDYYQFDPEKERIYKNNTLLPSYEVEPVYDGGGGFVGIHYKGSSNLITKSGKVIVLTSDAEIS